MSGRYPDPAAHLRYIGEARGSEILTIHVMGAHGPDIHADTVVGVQESLMAKFDPEGRDKIAATGMDGPYPEVVQDFILARA
ncbi:MAG: hypothetical protein AAFQ58_08535 [Pseudomonadota bacterium]